MTDLVDMPFEIRLIDEYRLTESQNKQIRQLLAECFPESDFSKTRTYLKQVPQYRLLANNDQRIVGHLGVDHRIISLAGEPASIFGISDVCVTAQSRGNGIASRMLGQVADLGRQHDIDFLVLFATDQRLYERNDFRHKDNTLRWMMVHEYATIGIDQQSLKELMVKPLTSRRWTEGLVDLLGHQF